MADTELSTGLARLLAHMPPARATDCPNHLSPVIERCRLPKQKVPIQIENFLGG